MQLNELFKDYSINTVSQKTNISIEVLKKLEQKEWDDLQQSKVNGFLSIIERDFNIDLSELKEEARGYYKEHKKTEPVRGIDVVESEDLGGNGGRIFANIITFLILGLVVYATWFYLLKPKDSVMDGNTTTGGMFEDSINGAKNLLGISNSSEVKKNSKKEVNATVKEENKSVVVIKGENESKSVEQKSVVEVKSNDYANKDINKTIKSTQEQKIVKSDNNKSEVNSASIETKSNDIELNKSDSLASSINKVDSNLSSNTELNVSDKNDTKEIIASSLENNVSELNATKDIEAIDIDTKVVNSFTITPKSNKIWIGLYNLKTKKRVVKVASKPYVYSNNGADVAIVTGHSYFDISTDSGESKKLRKKGKKAYILVTNSGIKKISKDEYKKVTRRRAW